VTIINWELTTTSARNLLLAHPSTP